MASVTVDDAIHQIGVAIEFGQLAVQHAPGGHPLYAAIEAAQEAIDWLNENRGIIPQPIADGTRTHQLIDEAVESINAAAATLRVDPTQPPPATIWPQVTALPWPWIAAGVGAVMVVAILFQRGD